MSYLSFIRAMALSDVTRYLIFHHLPRGVCEKQGVVMNNNDDKLGYGSGIGNWKPGAVACKMQVFFLTY